MNDKIQKTEEAVKNLLLTLDIDLEDPNFKDTPYRVSKLFHHFFRNKQEEAVAEISTKVFPSKNDQLVIVKDIKCYGMCPHHLAPIEYNIAIGYVPKGKVLGLSKLARLAIAVTSYPKLQEDITKEIIDVLEEQLKPLGAMCVVNGIHGCMRFRGVEMDATTITSDCRGVLRTVPEARAEFLNLLK